MVVAIAIHYFEIADRSFMNYFKGKILKTVRNTSAM
jgi:hypothetical protein